jgi:hypothetical protein
MTAGSALLQPHPQPRRPVPAPHTAAALDGDLQD